MPNLVAIASPLSAPIAIYTVRAIPPKVGTCPIAHLLRKGHVNGDFGRLNDGQQLLDQFHHGTTVTAIPQ